MLSQMCDVGWIASLFWLCSQAYFFQGPSALDIPLISQTLGMKLFRHWTTKEILNPLFLTDYLDPKNHLPDFSYQVVESMRLGMEPKLAAQDAIKRIARKFPDFVGAVFAFNKNGLHAGACHGWTFQYSVRSPEMEDVEVFTVFP